jgi:hypothetical protein
VSRYSRSDIASEAVRRGIAAQISGSTVWRWLHADAIRPWQHRSWIFPRDPQFETKAGRVLDLYQGLWLGEPLSENDFVLCADEKPSIQPRRRKHPSVATKPGRSRGMRVEHEYERRGALTYMATWDVRRAKLFGRCEEKCGIEPFERMVRQVMEQEPYRSARRVFWVMDNGSSHRGERGARRLADQWPKVIPVHLPVHASWLNQVEVYFSIVQRKVLTPSDFESVQEVQERLIAFQEHYEKVATPFEWKFTRQDLHNVLNKLTPTSDTQDTGPTAKRGNNNNTSPELRS